MARVVIVGGGLAGLTAAFRLCGDAQVHVDVLEAGPSLGGQIQTDRSAGFAIERGAEGGWLNYIWIVSWSVTAY